MKEVNIAMAMLRQNRAYLLQLRGGAQGIGAVGLIGCFGGQIEERESGLQAVAREIGEETNLRLPPSRFVRIGTVKVPSDMKRKPVRIIAEVFTADVPAALQVEATEGSLVVMTLQQMREEAPRLTSATRACVEQLMGGE